MLSDAPREPSSSNSVGLPSHIPADSELAELLVLHSISLELIQEHSIEHLYEKIIDAAVRIMHSDYASMQMLFPERGTGGELRLVAFRGFNPEAARFWEWVRADSKSTCGAALSTRQRVVAPDISSCEFMIGSEDQQIYLGTGIHACPTTPLIARDGNVVGMISTHWHAPHNPSNRDFYLFDILARQAADLIERTRREQVLSQRAALLELSTDAIIVREGEGRILYWNRGAERLYGWTREEAIGKNIHLLLQTRFPEPLDRIRDELSQSGKWQGELVHTTREGRSVIVLCRKVLDRKAQSGASAVMETNTDITDRRRIEKLAREQERQLRKTEKLLAAGQLASSLAHEINNPLSSITNVLYLLNQRDDLPPDARTWIATAEAELARVSRIVRQSLSYYQAPTVPVEADLANVLEESLRIFSDRFRRSGVQLVKKITPGAPIVAFPDEIRQVVDNLLLNALEATPHGGRLLISLRQSRNWQDSAQKRMRLTIADAGCGISQEHLPSIFEPFFTTKNQKGTGLGLWVVQGIVQRRGGRIRVRSKATGSSTGTVISILWPAAAKTRPLAQSESAA